MISKLKTIKGLEDKGIYLFNDKVENQYNSWEQPDIIISDGAYGVSGFKGDTVSSEDLPNWYETHIQEWTKKSKAGTTLWFWNTEIGFARINPILEKYGWEYVSCNVWNKGIQHIAGNCNLKMLKSYPIVTEVCVQYVKRAKFIIEDKEVSLKDWLRQEWNKAGLTLYQANEACDIANAASRKYLTKDHLWYAPPPEHFENLVKYANKHGNLNGKPYFSVDGIHPLSKKAYTHLFPIFNGKYGITNVWDTPPLHSKERIKVNGGTKCFHLNQKPLKLMELIISSSTYENDVIWEPFGGLFSASLAAYLLKRKVYGAEIDEFIFQMGISRFEALDKQQKEQLFEISNQSILGQYAAN
jgi:DNA methylase